MKRRKFINTAALSLSMLPLFASGLPASKSIKQKSKLEKRTLGRTGEKLSIIGFGGIVVRDVTVKEASERVKEAISYGVNYFDVAPTYGDAELKLGPALKPYRKNIFLACKTTRRLKGDAERELEQSLERMQTDYFDLYQLHAVNTFEEIDHVFGQDGAMKTLLNAREKGKVRYLGFSSHSVEAALELMKRFEFDTILFPVNFATWYSGNFGPQVLESAKDKGMGILALKAMAKSPLKPNAARVLKKAWYEPLIDPHEAAMGMRFTLSHPVTSAIPPGDENLFKLGLTIGMKFTPLSNAEIIEIKKKALETEPLFKYSIS